MLLKILGLGSQSAPDESAPQGPLPEEQEQPTEEKISAGEDTARPKRTLKRILLQWSIALGGLGIVGAVGLPMLINSVSCGGMIKEIQGRTYADSMNRAQQAFYLENGRFAQTWEELEMGSEEPSTEAYRFRTEVESDVAFNYAEVKPLSSKASRTERREHERFFAIVGAAALWPDQASPGGLAVPAVGSASDSISLTAGAEAILDKPVTQAILCQADEPGVVTLPKPELIDGQLACAAGTTVYGNY